MKNDYGNWIEQTINGVNAKVNTSTGEVRIGHERIVYEGDYISTPELREAQKKYREEQEKKEENRLKRRNIGKRYGKHFFVPRLQFFPDLKPQTAARLIYLLTYADYTEQGSFLRLTQKTLMTKKDLKKVLGLSVDSVYDFLAEVSPSYITITEENHLTATEKAYKRGSLKDGRSYHRFYDHWVRSLYRAVPPRQHRHLGYIFQLLPYISIEYNVLCYNPNEEDTNNIELMYLADFCDKIGFDKSHAERLLKIYREIQFQVTDKTGTHTEKFVSITCDGPNSHNAKIYVNPRILYSGAHPEWVELLGTFSKG